MTPRAKHFGATWLNALRLNERHDVDPSSRERSSDTPTIARVHLHTFARVENSRDWGFPQTAAPL